MDKKKKKPPISTESLNIAILIKYHIDIIVEKISQKTVFFLTLIAILRRNVTSTS